MSIAPDAPLAPLPAGGVGAALESLAPRPKIAWPARWLKRALWTILLAALLYWALRNAPLAQIALALKNLRPGQIAVLLGLNALIYALITARWWLIVRAGNPQVGLLPLLGVRLSVFGISYFTLGPQIGGEPLQVLYLQKKYGLTYTHAAATVVMDKLLEFMANFALLGFGLTAVLRAGILSGNGGPALGSLIGLAVLLAVPPVYLALIYKRVHPLWQVLGRLSFIRRSSRPIRFLRAAEHLAGAFCRSNPASLLAAIGVSLLAAAGIVSEYALMTSFLQIHLSFWQIAAAWTAGWLAFLVPLPGGLGALEAGQVFALGNYGVPAASAVSVTLLIRGRDILFGGLGLLLAGRGIRRR